MKKFPDGLKESKVLSWLKWDRERVRDFYTFGPSDFFLLLAVFPIVIICSSYKTMEVYDLIFTCFATLVFLQLSMAWKVHKIK